MYIKNITMENFRSFREQASIEDFSEGTNAVVGRNGSGKSNLFDAIQFCLLAPRFASLTREEKKALLHEGSGQAAVSGFCEIVFDNADRRFQNENDDVVIKRAYSAKKDEFFLNGKRVQKQEIQSLLESAGFSKSNPYNMVQQGKIQDLCLYSDSQRLNLLHQVAGTVTYDEKKVESTAKMTENEHSLEKIREILEDMEERLETLEAEKEELTAYQQADKERRAVEYALYEKELQKARHNLNSLDDERSKHSENKADLDRDSKELNDKIKSCEGKLRTTSHAYKRHKAQLAAWTEDAQEASGQKARLEWQVRELRESLQEALAGRAARQAALSVVQKEIAAASEELQVHEVALQTASSTLQEWQDSRDEAARQTESLYAKQGRGRQYQSVQERDEFLQREADALEQAAAEKKSTLAVQQDALAHARRAVKESTEQMESLEKELQTASANLLSLNKETEEMKRQRLASHAERKTAWRAVEELRDSVKEARETLHTAHSDIRHVMPKATAMGLAALQSLVEKEGLVVGQQYFGTVMENLQLKRADFATAVEKAAQNSLFFVIVDKESTAARLVKQLEEGRLGRVTFLPLAQLRIENVTYPDAEQTGVQAVVECVQFDPKLTKAMQHVFHRKLLAKDQEAASEWSTKLSMDVVTMEGDLCSRKGHISGGYVDTNKSRLRAHQQLQTAKADLANLDKELHETTRKAQQAEQSSTNMMQGVQRLEAKQAELNRQVKAMEAQLERLQSRHDGQKKQIEKLERTVIPPIEREIAVLAADKERLQKEIGTELVQTLSDEDRQLLAELKQLQAKLAVDIEAQSEKVAQVGVERQKLQSLLEDNLLKREEELLNAAFGGVGEEGDRRGSRGRLSIQELQAQRQDEIEDRQRDLDAATRVVEELEAHLEEARAAGDKLRGELISGKNELEQLRSEDTKIAKASDEAKDKLDRLLNKIQMCRSKQSTYSKKIQELGSLPSVSEKEKFAGKSISDLMKCLETVNKKLKKYSHVNKKAFDQFVKFSENRKALLIRKKELDDGAKKVKELVESLDRKKDEAINRTFRGVSAHFKDVFEELVPNGAGELILRTALDEVDGTDEENSESDASDKPKKIDPNNPDVSQYLGVAVKVRFSEVGENYMMSQLSGGQKALVALALIFAIQRCEPVPFYLFDELDQALDPSYRAAVAGLIQRQANSKDNPTQFIVSTFRPELVEVANHCYGVEHQNKVSKMHHTSKRDSLAFIASIMSQEEAVGEVTSISTSRATRTSRKRKAVEESPEGDEDDNVDMSVATA